MGEISEVLPGKLYLGNVENSRNDAELRRLKVTHIVNVTKVATCCMNQKCTYLNIPVDDGDQKLSLFFDKAYEFIDQKGVIFIHCRHGISRSATIVIAFLMRK